MAFFCAYFGGDVQFGEERCVGRLNEHGADEGDETPCQRRETAYAEREEGIWRNDQLPNTSKPEIPPKIEDDRKRGGWLVGWMERVLCKKDKLEQPAYPCWELGPRSDNTRHY